MTAQEVFDIVVSHLRTQNSKSIHIIKCWGREWEECSYRGDEGKKCAAGILIDDKEYDLVMEGYSFSDIIYDTPSLKNKYEEHIGMITSLQFLHDFIPTKEWETELKRIATDYKLDYKEVIDG